MRNRIRATLIAISSTIGLLVAAMPAHAAVTPPKVVIIVGPTGSVTNSYRSEADDTAAAAEAAGADVTKVYSPNATWANVKAAVDGANIVVYYGHGNGYPNPYSSTFYGDRVDGWGLNRTTSGGDDDNWSTTMVYCGEKALLGTLTSSDGSAQQTYCSGGPITPAPGWVMIYSDACYAPGASEPGNTPASPTEAMQRVGYFSRPVLAGLGASAYFATDRGADPLVSAILSNPGTAYGDIYSSNLPQDWTVTELAHPYLSGLRLWLGLGTTPGSYKYAFAGEPGATFAGGSTGTAPPSTTGVTTYNPPAALVFPGGTTVGYRFDAAGKVTATRSYTLARASGASTSKRSTVIPNHPGAWYYVVNGVWAGYWVAETSHVHLADTAPAPPSTTGVTTYNPPAALVFPGGTTVGYRFDAAGKVTATRSYTLARASGASTSKRSTVIPNHPGAWYYVVNGVWAGYWVAETSHVHLAG